MILHGRAAVKAVEVAEARKLSVEEERVVMLEGYATTLYQDHKGIDTYGVGQTGEWISKSFRDSFNHHVNRVRNRLPDYDKYPQYLRTELIASEYRGDLGLSPKTIGLIRDGRFKAAAEEFLDHKEYKNPNTPTGVRKRLEALFFALMLRSVQ